MTNYSQYQLQKKKARKKDAEKTEKLWSTNVVKDILQGDNERDRGEENRYF